MNRRATGALRGGGMVLVCAVVWVHVSLAQHEERLGGAAKEAARSERVERLQDECRKLRGRLVETEAERAVLKQRLQARLTALYKFRALGYASALLPADSDSNAMEVAHLVQQIGRADLALGFRWQEGQVRQHHLTALLARRQSELELLEHRTAGTEKRERLPGNGSDEASTTGTVASREERDQGGSALFKKVPHRKPIVAAATERFSALRGALPPPTAGEMVMTYGAKGDKKGEAFLHTDGVTIVAPKGQAIEAVFDGIVVFSDWLKEYGNVMIIDHGEHYHSLVAHAEQLFKQVGDSVRRGEVVATVGSTGSSNTAQLYFEIRYHGRPVNPMEWLASGK